MDNIILQKLIVVALIAAGTGVVIWLVFKLFNTWGAKLANLTKSGLDNAILSALRLPVIIGVALAGLWLVCFNCRR
ncbi:MAG: hypothetical protein ACE5G8_15260 [Anaerolineae bacterium]